MKDMDELLGAIKDIPAPKDSLDIKTNSDRLQYRIKQNRIAAARAAQERLARIFAMFLFCCLILATIFGIFAFFFTLENGEIKRHHETVKYKRKADVEEYLQHHRDQARLKLEQLEQEHKQRIESEKLNTLNVEDNK